MEENKEKRVLVPVAQGIEEMEAITIIDVLRRAGAHVTVASVDEKRVQAARGICFEADCLIADIMDRDFDLVALPGGIPGAQNLAASEDLARLLKSQAAKQALYGGICASPAVVLHPLGLAKEGAVTCHPGFAHLIGDTTGERVSKEGCCITSRGGGTSLDFALALVEQLFPKETLEEVRAGLALN